VFFLIMFCWLGFLTAKIAPLLHGFKMDHVPVAQRFVLAYGLIAFPLCGIVAAATFFFSDVLFRNRSIHRWILQLVLFAAYTLLFRWGFRELVVPIWGPVQY
jgi:hypothetical protein